MEIRLGGTVLNDYASNMSEYEFNEWMCCIYKYNHQPTNTKALELFDLNSHNRIRSALR